ncbi:MAG: M28 family peptidase [Cyanobacteria bacterium P01_A01_bin.114]
MPLSINKDAVAQNLVSHLRQIVRERDPFLATQGHFYVQQYLQQQLGQWGTVLRQPFQMRERTHYNLSLALPGAQSGLAPLLIGAHYDTVPGTVGADDNATGLAVLLELARLLAPSQLQRPIIFAAFDLEEFGLAGSRAWVEAWCQARQPLYLMLSLEMLGYCDRATGSQQYPAAGLRAIYPDRGDFIALIGNWQSVRIMRQLKRSFRQGGTPCEWLPMVARGQWLPDTRRSDHAPFWDAGFNAILVTDTSEFRNPHYHQATDTLETLDLEFLTGVCLGLAKGLPQL